MNSTTKTTCCVLALLGVLACERASAATVEVTASALNIRSGPGTSYAVIGTASRGERMTELGRSGSWVQVDFRGQTGWAHGAYLQTVAGASSAPGSTYTVTASSLNVRSGPGTGYRVIGSLGWGTSVQVVGSSGDWRQIAYGSGTGWVHGAYLMSGSSASSSPSSYPGVSARPSQAGFIQMPASGPWWYGYYAGSKRWGTPSTVYGTIRAARAFKESNPGAARVGVGDISNENGGYCSGHNTHRDGRDVDLRPVRKDNLEQPVTIHDAAYSRTLTQSLIGCLYRNAPAYRILFNDGGTTRTTYYQNHHNHLHVDFN